MDREELRNYIMQTEAQKDIYKSQADESIKPYLPQLHQQIQEAQAVVIDQINPKRVVAEILLELDGKSINEKGEIEIIGKPYLNNQGLRNVKLKMRGIIHQANTMSDLRENEIKAIMLSLQKNLCFDLALNWREYGIKNRTICDTIMDIILINCYTILKRSQDRNEKGFLKGIAFESIGGSSQSQRGKKGGSTWEEVKKKIRL